MVPTLKLLIPAFAGIEQGQNILTLPAAYSEKGSYDTYLDKRGQIRAIMGSLAITPGNIALTSGGIAGIRGMYLYRKYGAAAGNFYGQTIYGQGVYVATQSDFTLTRQLLLYVFDSATDCELHVSEDGGVTTTKIAELGVESVNAIPCFAMFGNLLFLTNGAIAPVVWDGNAISTAGGTQLSAPTVASGGAGNLSGVYRWRIIPVLDDGTRDGGSEQSAALSLQDETGDVSWSASSNPNTVGYEVYRTTGSGLDFYLAAYVDGAGTTNYIDDLPDADLIHKEALSIIAAHGDPPPTGTYFCVAHGGRFWWLRTDAFPRRAWFSDPGDPDSVYLDRNYVDCTDAESFGDALQGGTGDFNGILVLWCNRSVWTVSGTGQFVGGVVDFRRRRSNARAGTVSVRTTAKVPQGHVFTDSLGKVQRTGKDMLAYLTPLADIRLFDGNSDLVISDPVQDVLKRMNKVYADRSYCYDDEERGMLVWVIPADESIYPNLSIAWNYRFGTWHVFRHGWGHVIITEEEGDEATLIAGHAPPSLGKVFRLWEGVLVNGTSSISPEMTTVPIYPPVEPEGPPDLYHLKRFLRAVLLFENAETAESMTVAALTPDWEEGDFFDTGHFLCLRTVDGSGRVEVPLRVTQDFAALLNGLGVPSKAGKYSYGVGIRLRVNNNLTTSPWVLKGIELEYQIVGDGI